MTTTVPKPPAVDRDTFSAYSLTMRAVRCNLGARGSIAAPCRPALRGDLHDSIV